MPVHHPERHVTGRICWLRAAVLGANDGIVSSASLVLGVAAAQSTHSTILVAGTAGLVAGAMSMAAGEYVSVHSQADTEQAELERELAELDADAESEHRELTAIYVARGLDPALADQVAEQLMAHDAIGAHARDELGITETLSARPIQAALVSAGSFAVGAILPLLVVALAPGSVLIPLVSVTSLAFLAILGGVAARAGGAGVMVGSIRVLFWGALAMALTAGVGALLDLSCDKSHARGSACAEQRKAEKARAVSPSPSERIATMHIPAQLRPWASRRVEREETQMPRYAALDNWCNSVRYMVRMPKRLAV